MLFKFYADFESQALIAYIIVFNQDKENAPAGVFDTCNPVVESIHEYCVEKHQTNFSLQDLSSTLVRMAIFASYNIDWEEKTSGLSPHVSGTERNER